MESEKRDSRPFNYARLKARTVEYGKTDKAVATACKMTASTYSLKLNGKGEFSQAQICDIYIFLRIEVKDIPYYFFTPLSLAFLNLWQNRPYCSRQCA